MTEADFAPIDEQIAKIVAYIRRGTNISDHVLVGPIVTSDWHPTDYFIVGSAEGEQARFDLVGSGDSDRDWAKQMRGLVIAELIRHRPIVIHDLDDELKLAELAMILWPSERTRKLFTGIKRERMN